MNILFVIFAVGVLCAGIAWQTVGLNRGLFILALAYLTPGLLYALYCPYVGRLISFIRLTILWLPSVLSDRVFIYIMKRLP